MQHILRTICRVSNNTHTKKGKANNFTENMGSAEKKNVKFLNMLNLICNKRNANENYSGILFLTW